MGERYINRLLLVYPQVGTWPTTQACALTGWELIQRPFGSQVGAQSTESHQPGMDKDNRVGTDCGKGGWGGQGRAMGEN